MASRDENHYTMPLSLCSKNLNIQEFKFCGIVSKSEGKDKEGVDVISVCHNKMVGMKTSIFCTKKEETKNV